AVGRPVAGDGEVTHVLAVPVVGGGPGAGVRQDVVPDGVVPRALVEVDAEPAVGAQAVVVADHRARVPRERVDAAAVGHLLHDVVHVVADEPVAGGGGGRGVARLEVVQAAVGVVGAAARLVGSPAVPDRQAGVRQVVDLVVGHVGAGDVRGQDRDDAPVVQAEVVDAVVADGDVPVDHPLVARVVRLAAHAAGHDAAGRAVGDLRAGDRDVGGAQADPAGVRVGVVADADGRLSQVDEARVGEGDVVRRGDLHGGGHLVPVRPGRLELAAALVAGGEGGPVPVARYVGAGLLVHVALVLAGAEPARAGEGDPAERDVVRGRVVGSPHVHQRLEHRQLHADLSHVLPGERDVGQRAVRGVEVPLPRRVEELVGVDQVGRPGAVRAGEGVVAEVVVVPGGLPHRDEVSADALHGRVPVGERADALHLHPALVGEVVQVAQRAAGEPHPGAGRGGVGPVDGGRGRGGGRAVDVQLAGAGPGRDGGAPDVLSGVGQGPSGDRPGSADDRVGPRRGLPSDGVAVVTGVRGGQLE